MIKKAHGYLPSDPTDIGSTEEALYGSIIEVPDSVNWLQYVHDTRDQGAAGSCVGQGISQGLFIRMGIENAPYRRFPSARYIYKAGRLEYGRGDVDEGLVPRWAFKALNEVGYAAEDDCPYSVAGINDPLGWGEAQAAYDQRIADFYRIYAWGEERCLEVKRALAQGFPVVFGMILDQTFDSYQSGLILPQTGSPSGRHMMCLFGYDKDGAFGINSWGSGWGQTWAEDPRNIKGGIFHISWEAIGWAGADDFWCFTTAPGIPEVK